MSTAANIAAVASALKRGWQAFCKIVDIKRRQIARAELEADNGKGKDMDGDGVVGGVGNDRWTRDGLRGRGQADRSSDAQRQVLDQGRTGH